MGPKRRFLSQGNDYVKNAKRSDRPQKKLLPEHIGVEIWNDSPLNVSSRIHFSTIIFFLGVAVGEGVKLIFHQKIVMYNLYYYILEVAELNFCEFLRFD